MQQTQTFKLKDSSTQREHDLTVTYEDCIFGYVIYLMWYVETNKYYVGVTQNAGDRVQNHFDHQYGTYQEALKNKHVIVKVLKNYNTRDEAKRKEQLWIKKAAKLFGKENLLNKQYNN